MILNGEREASGAAHVAKVLKEEEDKIDRKLKEEISKIRADHAAEVHKIDRKLKKEISHGGGGVEVNRGKLLKLYWKKVGEEYSADTLKELFSEFGQVKDFVMGKKKKRGSVLIDMATEEQVVS